MKRGDSLKLFINVHRILELRGLDGILEMIWTDIDRNPNKEMLYIGFGQLSTQDEQSFLIRLQKVSNCTSLVVTDRLSIRMPKVLNYRLLQHCLIRGLCLFHIHTHNCVTFDCVQFSAKDLAFQASLHRVGKLLGNRYPVTFIVVDPRTYTIRLHWEDLIVDVSNVERA